MPPDARAVARRRMTRPPRAHQGRPALAAALLAAARTAPRPAPAGDPDAPGTNAASPAVDTAAPGADAAAPAAEATEPPPGIPVRLPEVVVTARRIKEPVENTPVSVTP